MDLTARETKFLTIMNETRLADGKLFKRDSEEISKLFLFTDRELNAAIKKLTEKGMLSEINLGGNETIYFFTEKVSKDMLDKKLSERQLRIIIRNKSIAQDNCPNCNIKLREKLHSGMYCSKCDWEK